MPQTLEVSRDYYLSNPFDSFTLPYYLLDTSSKYNNIKPFCPDCEIYYEMKVEPEVGFEFINFDEQKMKVAWFTD